MYFICTSFELEGHIHPSAFYAVPQCTTLLPIRYLQLYAVITVVITPYLHYRLIMKISLLFLFTASVNVIVGTIVEPKLDFLIHMKDTYRSSIAKWYICIRMLLLYIYMYVYLYAESALWIKNLCTQIQLYYIQVTVTTDCADWFVSALHDECINETVYFLHVTPVISWLTGSLNHVCLSPL